MDLIDYEAWAPMWVRVKRHPYTNAEHKEKTCKAPRLVSLQLPKTGELSDVALDILPLHRAN